MQAVTAEGLQVPVAHTISAGGGVPPAPVPTVTAEDVRQNGHVLMRAWRPMRLHSGHPSRQIPESLAQDSESFSQPALPF
jgi:hypothetical protein